MKKVEKIIDGCNEVKKNPEIHKDAKTLATLVIKDCNDVLDAIQKLSDSAALNSVPIGWVKKKEWVGLTDEEVEEIYIATEIKVDEHWRNGGTTMMFPITLYQAIEEKLKEKNNGY
jgi:hypothetical protein